MKDKIFDVLISIGGKNIIRFLILIIIILIFYGIKTTIEYMDYELFKMDPLNNFGYSNECIDYVLNNKPSYLEFINTEWTNDVTLLYEADKKYYLLCFNNLTFEDYPDFKDRKKVGLKEYSIKEALEKNILNINQLEKLVNDNFNQVKNKCRFKDLIVSD